MSRLATSEWLFVGYQTKFCFDNSFSEYLTSRMVTIKTCFVGRQVRVCVCVCARVSSKLGGTRVSEECAKEGVFNYFS